MPDVAESVAFKTVVPYMFGQTKGSDTTAIHFNDAKSLDWTLSVLDVSEILVYVSKEREKEKGGEKEKEKEKKEFIVGIQFKYGYDDDSETMVKTIKHIGTIDKKFVNENPVEFKIEKGDSIG